MFHFNDKISIIIEKREVTDISYIRFLYFWFKDWVTSLDLQENEILIVNTYQETFYSYLWKNIGYAISSKQKKYYYPFISSLFTGYHIYSEYGWENPVRLIEGEELHEKYR